VAAIFFAFFVKNYSGYSMFGYDYSRYLGEGGDRGFSFFSFVSVFLILLLTVFCTPSYFWRRVFWAAAFALFFKGFFYDLEVYSRVFQLQIDLLLIYVAINAKNPRFVFFVLCYAVVFFVGQLSIVSTSDNMIDNYIDAMSYL
jgi:hypothetical protein